MPILLLFIFLCCAHVAQAETAMSSSAPSSAPSNAPASGAAGAAKGLIDAADLPAGLDDAARVDFYCLRRVYPQITNMTTDAQGQWLVFNDGRRVLYDAAPGAASLAGSQESEWVVNVRASMAEPYPLEPQRPDTPLGVSPGRRRSYDLLQALYGSTPKAVGGHLVQARLLGQHLHLSPAAAQAMNRANANLAPQAAQEPRLKTLLKMDGGFAWRRIAGENRLSPHAFGIAFDISPGIATYWRWSKLRPHPLQQSYPSAIVAAFENEGFIWGGKWHEYDLMHFEYRPEIICKARVWQGLEPLPIQELSQEPVPESAPDIARKPAHKPVRKPVQKPEKAETPPSEQQPDSPAVEAKPAGDDAAVAP